MSDYSFARPSSAALQSRTHSTSSFLAPQITNHSRPIDPLQPLRAMADRVGKEVEKFAERVDHWHTHGNDTRRAKYHTTIKMVGKFRDVAEIQVKELKRAAAAENKGELAKSVRRRIQNTVEAPDGNGHGVSGQSSQSIIPPTESGSADKSQNLHELRQWQSELATWELVRLMIDHYHSEPGTNATTTKKEQRTKVEQAARNQKASGIWDRFLLDDDQAREKAVVRRWLEQTVRTSESTIEAITAELESASGKGAHTWTSGWLDTRSKIKHAKRLEGADQPLNPETTNLRTVDKTANLVTQLDPDAAARQKRALEKSDESYERALWMISYEMMRRGVPWKQIVEWYHDRSEGWRGVSVGAACDAHLDGEPNMAGPTVGYLFRRMCFYAARGARVPYESAVYGLLSGDLKQVQSVSRSWDEHLYAHYNALLLSRFDKHLQQKYPNRVPENLVRKFVFQDAVANLGDWEKSPQKVIGLLKQQKATASQSTSPFKLIQGALISRSVDELMLKVGVALADMLQNDERPKALLIHPDSAENDPGPRPSGTSRTFTAEPWYQALASDPHAFRVAVHILIVFQRGLSILNVNDEKQQLAIDNVVAAYIEVLCITKRIQLIPLYAAQIDPERAAHCLARVLPDIKNSEEQRRCVALLEQYRIDVIEVIAQSFTFAFGNSGFIHFDSNDHSVITNPIRRFKVIEQTTRAQEEVLWPGVRIKREFDGLSSDVHEDDIIEALLWYHHVGNDYEQTFEHLKNALTIFLLNGRLNAAERVVNDISLESLSLSRTEALCGYPFDITTPGSEEQDEHRLHEHRDSLSGAARSMALPLSKLPDGERHRQIVEILRQKSSPYYDLQHIVRLLVLFREWRHEEEVLIKIRNDRATDPHVPKNKPDTQRTKELLGAITALFETLVASISEAVMNGVSDSADDWNLKKAYMPDIVLAYLSVLQSSSYFLQRDAAVQAMEVAVAVADAQNEWLQRIFLQTGRMSELVDCLACVSKAMLRLTEGGEKKADRKKKRGSKGETIRIWDVAARDRK